MFLRAHSVSPTPDLVLVPPTPVNRVHPEGSPLSASSSSVPPTPELLTAEERSSSETLEIYSMYDVDDGEQGDEQRRESWRRSHQARKQTHSSSNSHGSSAYFSAISDDSARPGADSPCSGIDLEPSIEYRQSRTIKTSPMDHRDTRFLSPTPPTSRPGSTTPVSPPQPVHTPQPIHAPQISTSPPPTHNSLSLSRPASVTTRTSNPSPRMSMQTKDMPFDIYSAGNVSLTRSVDEDNDSFLVRSTYAQLERSGVKGDGYAEGVERTRAKIGPSRASEIMARDALGDEGEKRRELSPQEVQMLASLDRYGFYTTPSHDRLLLLPTAAFAKPFAKITVATTSTSAAPQTLRAVPPPQPPVHELERMEKWGRMLTPSVRDAGGNVEMWSFKPNKDAKLLRRVYKGIPDRWRAAAWEALMSKFARAGPEDLRRLKSQYFLDLDKPSSFDVQIDLDVPRTISGHILFKTRYGHGQRSLFHVLHSFSLHCGKCGYCQGMGPLAAMLLCYVAPERAYAALVHLHDAYGMHAIFAPGFPGLLESIYVQERLMAQFMPTVYGAFKKNMVSTTSYATKWYITLFANSVPFQTSLRLWDAFLLEGQDLFVVVAIAIIWAYRDHITSDSANFETMLSMLSSFFVPEDENALMTWIGAMLANKKLRADMVNWRTEWRQLVEQGKEGDALL